MKPFCIECGIRHMPNENPNCPSSCISQMLRLADKLEGEWANDLIHRIAPDDLAAVLRDLVQGSSAESMFDVLTGGDGAIDPAKAKREAT